MNISTLPGYAHYVIPSNIRAYQNSILCDSCLVWDHMDCVKSKQNGKYWFFDTCKLNK